MGPFDDGTANVGEFLAIVHAAAMLQREGRTDVPIYSDSLNALRWVRAGVCRTALEPTERNARLFDLIERARAWLRTNTVANPLLKWDTDRWGENPADFGRKK
jgi:ribonuclease HI